MEIKYILYKEEELKTEGILPEGLKELFQKSEHGDITVKELAGKSVPEELQETGMPPEDILVIAAKDETIHEIQGYPIAVIGYCNPAFAEQGLYGADILVEGFEEVDVRFLKRIYQRRHGIPWRVIETKRCYLREMTAGDLDDMFCLYAGEGMTEYMEPLYEREEEESYTKAYIETMYRYYGFGMWLVKDRVSDELIGRAGLNILDFEGKAELEMGYAIAVSRQRQGYALEVCRAILEFAGQEQLPYERICCFIDPENKASKGLLNRLGFSFLGWTDREGIQMHFYVYLLNTRQNA